MKNREYQFRRFGTDLCVTYGSGDGRHERCDLQTVETRIRGEMKRDLQVTSGTDNLTQALIHRLNTRKGELAPLGHPGYGSRHHELIGQPNTEHNRGLVKLYVLQAISQEPRVERILSAEIRYDRRLGPSRVDIVLSLSVGETDPRLNLVVPFDFEENA